jgi:hypothetical protein
MTESFWRRCSSCKREIAFDARYWTCSVTTCNRKGSSFVFCSVECWQMHVPTMRHREAWAEEQRAPTRAVWAARSDAGSHGSSPSPTPGRSDPGQPATTSATAAGSSATTARDLSGAARDDHRPAGELPRDILIVASKLKKYVRARSGMNTSDGVMEVLSKRVRALCDDAIARAREDGRKTVMDRDF